MISRQRGFEIVSSYQTWPIKLPLRKTSKSAGYDISALEQTVIQPGQVVMVKTGLKAYMKDNEVLQIYPRSSLSKNKQLMLINSVGIIDSDYYNNQENEGHIMVMIYNLSNQAQVIEQGERFAQGVFLTYLTVDEDKTSSAVRLGGFGSTGK